MSTRTVEVDVERIERWVTNFATRHGGATIEPSITDSDGEESPDDEGPPGRTGPATNRTVPDGDSSPGSDVLRLRGADGEIADLRCWSVPAAQVNRPAPGDATTAEALAAIAAWVAPPTHLGLVLIRRGGYAVGRAEGASLASHKSGTRYVQSRTAAGGWSQQRFARRRGNQADALVGTVVELVTSHLLPAPVGAAPRLPQAMVLGGDRPLVHKVLSDPALADLAALPQRMFADLPEPRFAVLEQALRRGRSIPVRITPGQ